jgi:hypothetical protein
MTTNLLNPGKGWPSATALDYRVQFSSAVLYTIVAGQSGHTTTADQFGNWQPGVTGQQMGLFLFQGQNDLDVNNTASSGQWQPVTPRGYAMCFPAKAPLELETTEYDSTQTYTANQPLRSPTGNSATAYPGSGQLTNQSFTFGTNAYCGLVSRGQFTNSYASKVIAFWPVYQPTTSS